MMMPDRERPCRIGTRGTPLALAQAKEVRNLLATTPGLEPEAFEIVVIRTTGDRVTDRPLREFGGKGLFTKEIEEALLEGRVDCAVHSMKDVPVIQPEGLVIDACLRSEDVRDAFVSLSGGALLDMPEGSTLGTSSLRRRAQALRRRPDLNVVEFRGNVQTRLRKLEIGVANGTLLAMAGLRRLGLAGSARVVPMDVHDMLPAVGQGIICIERREDDRDVAQLIDAVRHPETEARMRAERAFLARLDGSCQTPIAGYGEVRDGRLRLTGEILRPDGGEAFAGTRTGPVEDGPALGRDLAEALLAAAGP
ncbi:MAG: hydroxymethylbilane synthase, partial [Boseongicola sp. SB0675_bin_26]|nr:hydroxymethylbilane synthase [Boseongicola sp. SB0675_bin_26]